MASNTPATRTASTADPSSALAAAPGRVFSRDALMEVAYPDRRVVNDRTVDSHIRHLRQKFAALGADPIGTVHGLGYRFVGEGG